MVKKLCKLAKEDIKTNEKEWIKLTSRPKYLCTKCGRVAKDEKYLCKSKKM